MSILFRYPDGSTLESPSYPQFNLLAHVQLEECTIGSECGGHGKCGKDKLKVLQGSEYLSPVTEPEQRLLGEPLLNAGIRLGCQAFPDQREGLIEIQVLSEKSLSPVQRD
jgi:ferredoxin